MALNHTETAGFIRANYVSFSTNHAVHPRIGHLDFDTNEVTTLAYKSGAPVSTLYEVIEAGNAAFVVADEVYPLGDVKLLSPISGRDVLAVGKNHVDHAKEFHQSGFDSSDATEQPSHPVIFTKRATSIIAHGDQVYPHPSFTETLDYEGEVGVIIGKAGFGVSEEDAEEYVWGYTIINDFTARDRQRDHEQFFMSKSPDTFCPIGPVATFVNGEKRQDANTAQLIFSVPQLIRTLSEAQTLRAGDVLATGTPAGVGFGFHPRKFLKPGDEVGVRVTGLGTLTNRIAPAGSTNPTLDQHMLASHVPLINTRALDVGCPMLRTVRSKQLFYRRLGGGHCAENNITFIHGLGGSCDYFSALLRSLESSTLHVFDIEGHGLSPTSANSDVSIASYAEDVSALLEAQGVQQTRVVGHSMGSHGPPPPSPLPAAAVEATAARAKLVRQKGMLGVADALANAALSERTKVSNRLAVAALRLSLTGQHPEGYAKAAGALARAPTMDFSKISCPTLILTGAEDKVSPPQLCKDYGRRISGSRVEVIDNVGHWHLFEDERDVSELVGVFLGP